MRIYGAHHIILFCLGVGQEVTLTILRTDLEAPVEMPQMSMNHDKEERKKWEKKTSTKHSVD